MKLGQHSNSTTLRSLVDRYIALISPAFKDEGDSRFPRTVRPHARDKGATPDSRFGDVLCFHIGQAVLAYYHLLQHKHCDVEFARILFVVEMADQGLWNFHVTGDADNGFKLLTVELARAVREAKHEV